MMEHFDIDLLSEYKTAPLHDTEKVINPLWRELERQRNALENKLRYRRARFARWSLHAIPASEEKKYRKREKQKAELLEEIGQMEAGLAALKERKKQTSHHINWEELSEQDRFRKPMLGRKRLMDAVRMIAYRAETAMCALLRPPGRETTAARRCCRTSLSRRPTSGPTPMRANSTSKSIADRGQRWIEHWKVYSNTSTRWPSFSREPN